MRVPQHEAIKILKGHKQRAASAPHQACGWGNHALQDVVVNSVRLRLLLVTRDKATSAYNSLYHDGHPENPIRPTMAYTKDRKRPGMRIGTIVFPGVQQDTAVAWDASTKAE